MTWNLDRFCKVCGIDLEDMDALEHMIYQHNSKMIRIIYHALPDEIQTKILDKIVEVRPKEVSNILKD